MVRALSQSRLVGRLRGCPHNVLAGGGAGVANFHQVRLHVGNALQEWSKTPREPLPVKRSESNEGGYLQHRRSFAPECAGAGRRPLLFLWGLRQIQIH